MSISSGKSRPRRLRVGARVRYLLSAAGFLDAMVIEDRGFIRNGEQVVRIRTIDEPDFPDEFDTPVSLLEVVDSQDGELAA